MEHKENHRYLVAYPSPPGYRDPITCDKTLYWYFWEADRAAKQIGGWVIEVNLEKTKDQ